MSCSSSRFITPLFTLFRCCTTSINVSKFFPITFRTARSIAISHLDSPELSVCDCGLGEVWGCCSLRVINET
jgi:hypothetical protein